MNENDRVRTLSDALRAVAAADGAVGPSAAVEARLRAEVRTIGRARRRRTIAITLAAAAVLAAAVTIPLRRAGSSSTVAREASPPNAATSVAAAEVATAFFPLTYSSLPVSNAQLVRVQVPRSTLASFGLAPIDVPGASASGTAAAVSADLLVGEDGVARAIRFVRVEGSVAP